MTSSQMMLFGGGPPPVTYTTIYTSMQVPSSPFTTTIYGSANATGGEHAFFINNDNNSPNLFCQLGALNASGNGYAWIRGLNFTAAPYGNAYFSSSQGIATDSSNNYYFAFTFNLQGTGNRGILAKYNSSGTIQFQRLLTSAGNDTRLTQVGLNPAGTFVAAGGALVASGSYVGLVTLYNSSGTIQWQRQVPLSGGSMLCTGICMDSSNNVYATFNGSATANNGYVLKWNSSGTLQWQRQFVNGSNTTGAANIATDGTNLWMTSYYSFAPTFAKISCSAGTDVWQGIPTGFEPTGGLALNTANGDIYVIGAGVGTPSGTRAIVKINTSGVAQWGVSMRPGNSAGAQGVSINTTTGYLFFNGMAYPLAGRPGQFRLPLNGANYAGNAMGNTGGDNWVNNALTVSSTTGTNYTNQAGSLTPATGTATDQAGTQVDAATSASVTSSTYIF